MAVFFESGLDLFFFAPQGSKIWGKKSWRWWSSIGVGDGPFQTKPYVAVWAGPTWSKQALDPTSLIARSEVRIAGHQKWRTSDSLHSTTNPVGSLFWRGKSTISTGPCSIAFWPFCMFTRRYPSNTKQFLQPSGKIQSGLAGRCHMDCVKCWAVLFWSYTWAAHLATHTSSAE